MTVALPGFGRSDGGIFTSGTLSAKFQGLLRDDTRQRLRRSGCRIRGRVDRPGRSILQFRRHGAVLQWHAGLGGIGWRFLWPKCTRKSPAPIGFGQRIVAGDRPSFGLFRIHADELRCAQPGILTAAPVYPRSRLGARGIISEGSGSFPYAFSPAGSHGSHGSTSPVRTAWHRQSRQCWLQATRSASGRRPSGAR